MDVRPGVLVSHYRKLHVSMYADGFFRALSKPQPNAQTLWVYLLTGPHTSAIPGLSCAGEAGLAESLGWPVEAFRKAFDEVSTEGRVEFDRESRVLWLPNAARYNPPENPNVCKAWGKAAAHIPDCPLKRRALESLRDFLAGMGKPGPRGRRSKAFLEGFDEAYGKGKPSGTGTGTVLDSPPLRGRARDPGEQNPDEQPPPPDAGGGRVPGFGDDDDPAGDGPRQGGRRSTPTHAGPDPLADAKRAAREAFGRWSAANPPVGRRRPLAEHEGEHRPVDALVEQQAGASPTIVRGNMASPRHLLIPQAVEQLLAKRVEFKSVPYACGCVKRELEDWANGSVPAASGGKNHGSDKHRTASAGQFPEPARKPRIIGGG